MWCAVTAWAGGTISGTWTDPPKLAYVYVEGEGPVDDEPAPLVVGQRGQAFVAPETALVQGATVLFQNEGPDTHNIYSVDPKFNLGDFNPRETARVELVTPGTVQIACNRHPEMGLELLVVPNQWYTRVGPDGAFSIPGISAGEHTIVAWSGGQRLWSMTVSVDDGDVIRITPPTVSRAKPR